MTAYDMRLSYHFYLITTELQFSFSHVRIQSLAQLDKASQNLVSAKFGLTDLNIGNMQ
jgi:hypothetical protein